MEATSSNFTKPIDSVKNETESDRHDSSAKTLFQLNRDRQDDEIGAKLVKIDVECSNITPNELEQESLREELEKGATKFIIERPDGKFRCSFCEKDFTWQHSLVRHITCVHAGLKRFSCGHCGKEFKGSHGLNYHIRSQKCMRINIDEKEFVHPPISQSQSSSIVPTMENPIPPTPLTGWSKDRRNSSSDSGSSNIEKSKRRKLNHSLSNTAVPHQREDDGNFLENSHICYICGKSFSIAKTLKRHIKNVHETEPTFECHLCSKLFKSKRHLGRHKERVHRSILSSEGSVQTGSPFRPLIPPSEGDNFVNPSITSLSALDHTNPIDRGACSGPIIPVQPGPTRVVNFTPVIAPVIQTTASVLPSFSFSQGHQTTPQFAQITGVRNFPNMNVPGLIPPPSVAGHPIMYRSSSEPRYFGGYGLTALNLQPATNSQMSMFGLPPSRLHRGGSDLSTFLFNGQSSHTSLSISPSFIRDWPPT